MIHYGDSAYLAHTLAQAKFAQKGDRLILLGDEGNIYYRGVEFFPIADYFEEAAKFSDIFQLYRLNAYQHRWQMFCFQRWMCLSKFMETHQIDRCFTMDSDVLLYEQATMLAKHYDEFEMTVIQPDERTLSANGATSIIHSQDILRDLTGIMFEMFSQTPLNERIKGLTDGITDMTALALLRERYPSRVGNSLKPKNQLLIDQSILLPDDFEMDGETKRVEWIGGKPFGFHQSDEQGQQRVQFGSIHFHGHAKKMIRHYTSPWHNALQSERNGNILNFRLKKLAKNINTFGKKLKGFCGRKNSENNINVH